MKKFLFFSLFVLGYTSFTLGLSEANHFHGQSFFSVRTPFQSASPEREALWHYDWIEKCTENNCISSFAVVPFGGFTVQDDLASYFNPKGKIELNVSEFKEGTDTVNDFDPDKDLEARNFNLVTNFESEEAFSSRIKLNPVHSFFGVGLIYRKCITPCWWFEMSAPIMRVANKIEFREKIFNDGGQSDGEKGLGEEIHVGTMKEALKGIGWKYGIIDPNGKHTKWGIADIELKLGWEAYQGECSHLRTYVGIVVPTGNKPDPKYMFAPVVGNNQHFGVMFGSNNGFKLWEEGHAKVRVQTDVSARYLFPNNQVRSFDLIGKQWSRYIEVYRDKNAAIDNIGKKDTSGDFGINYFTKNVRVHPKFATTFNTSIICSYCTTWYAEFGYNLYARQAEEIELRRGKNDFDAALKHITGNGLTTKSRNIAENFAEDDQFDINQNNYARIQPKDLDLSSAAHPPMISQIVYAALGYEYKDDPCYPMSFSLGGSYEFSHNNAGLSRVMFWGKFGVAF